MRDMGSSSERERIEVSTTGLRSNPFSSRYTRPGAIAFRFSPGPKIKQLFERLRDTACWGQIVGPHGSGKSTLRCLLVERAADYGIQVVCFSLHDRQQSMPRGWRRIVWNAFEAGRSTMVIVDGFEQLSRFSQWYLKHICRTRSWGLLVTVHEDVGLPSLYRTTTSIDLADELVELLLPAGETRITRSDVHQAFRRHEGNLRKVFSDLYDHYERLR